jgi:hypothetical protein
MQSAFRFGTSPAFGKTQSFVDLDENSLLFLYFFFFYVSRSLNELFTPFYVAHATFSVGTSPATRKTQSFVDFDENSYFAPE